MSQVPQSGVSRWECPVCRNSTLASEVPLCRDCYDEWGSLRVMDPEMGQ